MRRQGGKAPFVGGAAGVAGSLAAMGAVPSIHCVNRALAWSVRCGGVGEKQGWVCTRSFSAAGQKPRKAERRKGGERQKTEKKKKKEKKKETQGKERTDTEAK